MANHAATLPDSGHMLRLLAYVYLENHRPEKSVVFLQALDALGMIDTPALVLLALAQQRASQPALALQTLDRLPASTTGGPLGAVVQLTRAQVLHALDYGDEALMAMQAYIQLRASHAGADDGDTR